MQMSDVATGCLSVKPNICSTQEAIQMFGEKQIK